MQVYQAKVKKAFYSKTYVFCEANLRILWMFLHTTQVTISLVGLVQHPVVLLKCELTSPQSRVAGQNFCFFFWESRPPTWATWNGGRVLTLEFFNWTLIPALPYKQFVMVPSFSKCVQCVLGWRRYAKHQRGEDAKAIPTFKEGRYTLGCYSFCWVLQ